MKIGSLTSRLVGKALCGTQPDHLEKAPSCHSRLHGAHQFIDIRRLGQDTTAIHPIRNCPKYHRHIRITINLLNVSLPNDGMNATVDASYSNLLTGLPALFAPPIWQ